MVRHVLPTQKCVSGLTRLCVKIPPARQHGVCVSQKNLVRNLVGNLVGNLVRNLVGNSGEKPTEVPASCMFPAGLISRLE